MNLFTISFSAIRATDLPLVGGKGANLGEMTHAGFPIPSGFCVTTDAFEQFIAACPDADDLYAQLETVISTDLAMARQVGQHVRARLLTVSMPPMIAAAVSEAWRQIGADEAYAVRSSATAEDLPDASFAGQQDTYLNVIGEVALLDAVRRCWVSLFTDRAILYRVQNKFSHRDVQLAVVVQKMVMSETSGILFTADPLTGHRHTAAIDASFGLGEALVSGLVSPDAYRVDKRDMTIIERQIADKQVAIYPEKEGGIRQIDLTADERVQPVLTDHQIIELAQLGSRVEAHYKSPQDIEWAMVGERLYLLQARPITSLFPIANLQSPDDSLHIFFSMGHQQMMTDAISPFGMSNVQIIVPIGRSDDALESKLIRTSGGRMYFDLTRLLRHPLLHKLPLTVLAQFDARAPEILKLAMQRPAFKRPHGITISFSAIRFVARMLGRIASALCWQDLTGFAQRANAVMAQEIQAAERRLATATTSQDKLRTSITLLQTAMDTPLFWIPKLSAGILADRLIKRIMGKRADPAILEAYTLALPGNIVTEMNVQVGDLADIARESPQLRALFAELGDDSDAWLAKAEQVADSQPFFEAWAQFLAHFGGRGAAEIDIRSPRWYEEPMPLLQVIASFLQKEAGSHRQQHQTLLIERQAAVDTIMRQAQHGLFGRLRVRLLHRLMHVVHEGTVLREHHKFYVVQTMRLIKECVKGVAQQLVTENKLAHIADVWFLTWPELLALVDGQMPDMLDCVAQRQAEYAQFENMTPPIVLTSDGETPVVKYHVEDAPPGSLVGNPVAPGIVEGVVHVIHDPQTETLRPGDILVATFTDPGWTPLFINAGGLVLEVGGAMTHGSVVAREYGIPAVVGVQDATKMLQTGQYVRVDGNRGVVEVLEGSK